MQHLCMFLCIEASFLWERNLVCAQGSSGWSDRERVGEARVILRVLDANDNAPVFVRQPPHTVTVREDLPVGSVVATLPAADLDAVSLLVFAALFKMILKFSHAVLSCTHACNFTFLSRTHSLCNFRPFVSFIHIKLVIYCYFYGNISVVLRYHFFLAVITLLSSISFIISPREMPRQHVCSEILTKW
jgi:hypothetical protein